MDQSIVFSIVIPVYNRAHVIGSCISSVLKQSFTDFEIIVVDDGSKDDTANVVRDLKDRRIVYVYQDNGGGSKARNTGIDHAKGRYIAFLDSDDTFLPCHLERALSVLSEAENICTYTQVIVNRGNNVTFLKPPRAILEKEPLSEYLMCDRGFIQTSTLIVPAKLAKCTRFNEKISFGQDTDFAIQLAASGADIRMLTRPGAVWDDTWSSNRLSSKSNPYQRIDWLLSIKPYLTEKAYKADLGWPVAKGLVQHGLYAKAFKYYIVALLSGCYKPKMSIVVLFQVFAPKSFYRKFSDFLAGLGVKP